MIRMLTISTLATVALWIADARPAKAWVMMGVLPKGEVPEQHCSKSLSAALKKVPPVRGETIDGFSHFSCTLYYRGTQENVQALLDGLGQIKDIPLRINVDRSGKVGKLESREIFPMERPIAYLYRVSISWQQLVDQGTVTPSPQPTSVNLTVYSGGGIEPEKLEIPDNAIDMATIPIKKVKPVGQ